MLNNCIIRCRGKPRTRLEIQKNQSMVLLRGKDVLEGKGEEPCPSRKNAILIANVVGVDALIDPQ